MRELEPKHGLVDQAEAPPKPADEAKLAELKTALKLFPTLHQGENLAEDIRALADLINDHMLNMEAVHKEGNLLEDLRAIEELCRSIVESLISKIPEDLSLPKVGLSEDVLILAIEALYLRVADMYYPFRPSEFEIPPKLLALGYGHWSLRPRV